jgi:hypothetical protein
MGKMLSHTPVAQVLSLRYQNLSMANCYFAKPHGMQHCYIPFLYVIDFKGALDFGEAHQVPRDYGRSQDATVSSSSGICSHRAGSVTSILPTPKPRRPIKISSRSGKTPTLTSPFSSLRKRSMRSCNSSWWNYSHKSCQCPVSRLRCCLSQRKCLDSNRGILPD